MKAPRLSLLNLLLITAIVALSVMMVRQALQLRQQAIELDFAEAELLRMRSETEQLEVEDTSRVTVRGIGELDWSARAWRIYTPPSADYRVVYKFDGLPADGTPDLGSVPRSQWASAITNRPPYAGGFRLFSGEYLFELDATADGSCVLRCRSEDRSRWTRLARDADSRAGVGGGRASIGGRPELTSQLADSESQGVLPGETIGIDVGERLILMDTRTPDDPGKGLLLWLEPIPRPEQLSPHFRPRLSLLNLLLITALVATGLMTGMLWREVGPLRQEVARLHAERGSIRFSDPTKLTAIRIPNDFVPDQWRAFRVHVPKGQEYYAYLVLEDIPKEGLPDCGDKPTGTYTGGTDRIASAHLEAGEHLLYLARDSADEGRRAMRLTMGGISFTNMPLYDKSARVVAPALLSKEAAGESSFTGTHNVFSNLVGFEPETVETGEPLVLLRVRYSPVYRSPDEPMVITSWSPSEPHGLLEGVMLWLEPVVEQP